MAKRRRLTPAKSDFMNPLGTPSSSARAPIAQVAGEAAAVSAMEEMRAQVQELREKGEVILRIPLEKVQSDYLIRDRVVVEDEALQSLIESIRARGQQTPIEVVEEPDGGYGLISGWRRLAALRALQEQGVAGCDQVKALIRQPKDRSEAYVAMVEENEVRADLSYYERARIVLKALEAGVFEGEKQALQTLFGSASYARRSKIKSFVVIVDALDGCLRFPAAIGERLGLKLAKALSENATLQAQLRQRLQQTSAKTANAEQAVIAQVLAADTEKPLKTAPVSLAISVTGGQGRVELHGPGVTPAFLEKLKAWVDEQQTS
jgi:ParB/RepB/Spo0J family partition protein